MGKQNGHQFSPPKCRLRDFATTKFEYYTPHEKAHMLLRGIRDSQDKKYTREHRVHTKNEALIPLDQSHVNLINNYKKNDVKYAELDSMVRRIGFGNLIKINLTHMPKMPNMPNMPNSEEEVQLERTNKKVRMCCITCALEQTS